MTEWRELAACTGMDQTIWFPDTTGKGYAKARVICAGCTVRKPCLDAAMLEEQETPKGYRSGMRGGLQPYQRYELAKGVARSYRCAVCSVEFMSVRLAKLCSEECRRVHHSTRTRRSRNRTAA